MSNSCLDKDTKYTEQFEMKFVKIRKYRLIKDLTNKEINILLRLVDLNLDYYIVDKMPNKSKFEEVKE